MRAKKAKERGERERKREKKAPYVQKITALGQKEDKR